ncbi:MAG: hypothetical protein LBH28_08640, partial [Oscillospiraceae bacterium]|nr:hypothetical protein [Oscillospiraceae bacterium]
MRKDQEQRFNESPAGKKGYDRGKGLEFLLLRYTRNTYYSPYGTAYHNVTEELRENGFSDDRRERIKKERLALLNPDQDSNVFGLKGEKAVPSVLFGQYDVLFVRPDHKRWTQRHINMVNDTVLMSKADKYAAPPGEIAVASHSVALFSVSDNHNSYVTADGGIHVPEGIINEYPFTAYISVSLRIKAYSALKEKEYDKNYLVGILGDLVRSQRIKNAAYRIHYTLHSADIMVEFKCHCASDALRMATSINGTDFFNTHSVLSSRVKYIEEDQNIRFEALPDHCVQKNKDNNSFAVKLSCRLNVVKEINSLKSHLNKNTMSVGANAILFGYYDTQLILSFTQFNCLYPILCENRLFKDNIFLVRGLINKAHETADRALINSKVLDLAELSVVHRKKCPNNEGCDDCSHCPVKVLIRELALGGASDVRSLTVEYLASLDVEDIARANPELQGRESAQLIEQEKRVEAVRTEIKERINDIIELRGKSCVLPAYRDQFMSATGMLIDLVNIFLPMGAQTDLFLDWFTIKKFVEAFINGVSKLADEIDSGMQLHLRLNKPQKPEPQKPDERESAGDPQEVAAYCERLTRYLIDLLWHGIDGINTFARLVQGVNLQFFSAASYELQTRVNAKKMIVAFSEYSNLLSMACNDAYKLSKQSTRSIESLAIPHINSVEAETIRLYPHGYIYNKQFHDGQKQPSFHHPEGESETHPMLVRMPSLEMFLRIYDILPTMHHEVSHHLHFHIAGEDNTCRNQFFARLVFIEISNELIYMIFTRSGHDYNRFYLRGRNRVYRELKTRIALFLYNEFINYRSALVLKYPETPAYGKVLFSRLKGIIIEF